MKARGREAETNAAREAEEDDAAMAKAAEIAVILGREPEIQELLSEVLATERIERQVKGCEEEKKERAFRKRLLKAGYECAPGLPASNTVSRVFTGPVALRRALRITLAQIMSSRSSG